jgi:hypothetical protein
MDMKMILELNKIGFSLSVLCLLAAMMAQALLASFSKAVG